MVLKALGQGIFSVFFPSNCRICGVPLTNVSRLPVCPECLNSMCRLDEPVCEVCGERLAAAPVVARGEARCGLCRRIEPPFVRAVAYGSYEAGLRDLIHLLKYERVRPAARVLGGMLAEAIAGLADQFAPSLPLVIPVPLHSSKERQRGFNQSELIGCAALRRKPAGLELELSTAALARRRATESQTGLTRHQRRENMRGAFAVTRASQVAGRDILLVDDVYTTGTTVSECARVLRRAGARRVWVATAARVLKPEIVSAALTPRPADQAPSALAASA